MADTLRRLKTALADRYAIEEELGAGGMATVYLAEDLKHHRKVAVKVLRPELAATLGPERFLREIQVTANLQHPHILPLYDSGQADGFLKGGLGQALRPYRTHRRDCQSRAGLVSPGLPRTTQRALCRHAATPCSRGDCRPALA